MARNRSTAKRCLAAIALFAMLEEKDIESLKEETKTRHCINLREAKTSYARGNARSKYTQFISGVDTHTHKVSLVGMRAFKNVEYGGQTNTTLLFTPEDKRNVEWR